MDTFEALKNADLHQFDPQGGVLALTIYWRPQPEAPLPALPGEKLFALSYLPTQAEDLCPCGSGMRFAACCQPLPYWRPMCSNPGMQGYRLLRTQSASFTTIPNDEVSPFLQDDERLYSVQDTLHEAMWLYWGDPVLESAYGILCFGDLKLENDRTLMITALSDARMEMLLDLVRPLKLGIPQIHIDPFPYVKKPTLRSPQSKRRQKH